MLGWFKKLNVKALLFHSLQAVFFLAIGGIVGNRSDAYFMSSWPEILKSITTNIILWICLTCSVLVCIHIGWLRYNDRDTFSKLTTFDTTLDMLLPEIITTQNTQDIARTYVESAFDITIQYILSSPRKAQLFLPDSNNQYLTCASS